MLVAMKPHTPTMMPISSAVERNGVDLVLEEPEVDVDDEEVDDGELVWKGPLDVLEAVPTDKD